MNTREWFVFLAAAPLLIGCRTAPRGFQGINDPAALHRARAAGLDDPVPDTVAIPQLIQKLDDPDAVVRLSAHESLRQRTGQDFGFQPWADPSDRAPAVLRWQSWWQAQGIAAPPEP